jgi:GMP synthase-like glutamine amidotransferase
MKKQVLLVNCYQDNSKDIIVPYVSFINQGAESAGIEVDVTFLSDAQIADSTAVPAYDAAIVSGSPRMVSVNSFFHGFIDFLRGHELPLLGICYGNQVLARAFGCSVIKDSLKHKGKEDVVLEAEDPLFAGFPECFKMDQSHEEVVSREPPLENVFKILAVNGAGGIEAIRHRELPLYGVQFHPERSGDLGVQLAANFLKQA